ncbi:DNA-binding MarR family transcriptional regulator [Nocardioides luteus]|uniref:Transcriptional regulator n=1 Tax=Nocardioides luteus TaxID=1844 RepID=A0ABQ5T0U5_9ACTN|nr:MarR family winged helix-turn-helix transcriptional regulator [Nocardioides luteus]MDR7310356.1 DNA-binding MarR family transcriptional regulator [Nocardioides luteus]GGR53248.1 transcriptional regulator [Nocardioides luteus]GLJ69864.1 transcriptional regulator [Nocardioides luteus]
MSGPEAPEPLRYTGHLLRRAQQVHLAVWQQEVSTEVTSVQFAALAVLDGMPGASQAELGADLFLDRSTIADVVSRMVRRGLIARTQDTVDRRRKTLTLTADGRAALETLRPRVEAIEPLLTGGLTTVERADLRRLLDKMLAGAGEQGLLR